MIRIFYQANTLKPNRFNSIGNPKKQFSHVHSAALLAHHLRSLHNYPPSAPTAMERRNRVKAGDKKEWRLVSRHCDEPPDECLSCLYHIILRLGCTIFAQQTGDDSD